VYINVALRVFCETGDVAKSDAKNDYVSHEVTCQPTANHVTRSPELTKLTPPRLTDKDDNTAKQPADAVRSPEVVRQGDKMALPEVSSLGDREPTGSSNSWFSPPAACRDGFSSRTWAVVPPPPPLHAPPHYRVMTSAVPPPPPPPLPGHVMRLFATSSNTRLPRFPKMGHHSLASRSTLQLARPTASH